MQNFKLEQDIRSSVDEQLKNLGWLFSGKDRNVFQEQPRETDQKKKLKGKRPDYVLYSSKDKYRKEPIIILETKKPGENLNDALSQGDWYAEQLNAPIVFATDGIYYKTLHTKYKKPLILNGEEVNELIRELEAIKFLENNEVDTISKEVRYDRQQLINIFEEANYLLRDEGFKAGMDRFSEFANVLFLKLLGEIEDLKEERRENFLVSSDFRWSHWKNKKGDELLRFVNDTVLKEMGKIYEDADIFTPLAIKNPVILKRIIDKLEPLNLINIDSDIKGDAFEYFLQKSTATKNDLGEYFTPRHIVKTMVKLINPQIGEKIYDPFCGTGGMLIESFKHIANGMAHTKSNWDQLKKNTIFGNEITNTARITKMNMILIGDGHSGIQQKNSLKNPIEDQYDIVVTNMPYSQKTEYGSLYDLQNNNGDSICVQHCIKAIDKTSENGRMAIIVPEGFLFRKDMKKTREYLLDRCYLKSIISLPQGVFLPYTGVKTNILYCTDIKEKKKQEKFWYFDVKNDGYSLDNHRRKIEGETDLQKFLAYRNTDIQEKKDILSVGFYEISMRDVEKNDLVLVGGRYKQFINYDNVLWKTVKLSEISKVGAGNSAPQDQKLFENGKHSFFRVSDVAKYHITDKLADSNDKLNNQGIKGLKKYPKNTILFPKSGASTFLNHRAMLGTAGYVSSHMATIEPIEEKVLPRYLFYLLRGIDAKNLTVDQNYPSLKLSEISNLKIPLPSLEKQQEVVDELDNYQKIYDNSSSIASSYEPRIDIDNNCKFLEISEVANIRPKKSEISKLDSKTKVSFIPMSVLNEHDSEIKPRETKKITEVFRGYTYFTNDDVLLAKITPCFENGKSGIAKNLENGIGFGSTEFIVIRANKTMILPEWIYYFISSNKFIEQGKRTMTGSAGQQRINIDFVRKYKIPVPKLDIQKKLINQINKERSLINSNIKLSRLMNDKINKKINYIWGK